MVGHPVPNLLMQSGAQLFRAMARAGSIFVLLFFVERLDVTLEVGTASSCSRSVGWPCVTEKWCTVWFRTPNEAVADSGVTREQRPLVNTSDCRGGVARRASKRCEVDIGKTIRERKARVMRTLHAGEGDLREDVIDELVHAFRHCRPNTQLSRSC